jgi:hypothetical protein
MERMNRRKFIGTAVAGTLVMDNVLRPSFAGTEDKPKLKLGLIGCGWYGMVDRAAFKITASGPCLCDGRAASDGQRAEVEKLRLAAKTFKHYADLLQTPAWTQSSSRHRRTACLPFIDRGRISCLCKTLAYDSEGGQ